MPEHWCRIQRKQLHREIDIYSHLPLHPRLVGVLDCNKDGNDTSLTLEYMTNGNLALYLRNNSVTTEHRAQWALQVAQGVAMLHAHNVIHADLKTTNLLLDTSLGLRIADFNGSSLLGNEPYLLESGPFYMPAERRKHGELGCDIMTDLFALGSCIFHIATGEKPYEGLTDNDIEEKFAKREFPGLEGVMFGDVIRKCWLSELESAEAVLEALSAEARDVLGNPDFPLKVLG